MLNLHVCPLISLVVENSYIYYKDVEYDRNLIMKVLAYFRNFINLSRKN